MKKIKVDIICKIETPYNTDEEIEIYSCLKSEAVGICSFDNRSYKKLNMLRGYNHAILVYNKSCRSFMQRYSEFVTSINNKSVFLERKPKCSNKIGIAIVEINKIIENKLYFTPVNILNNSELIDVKPFVKAEQKDTKLIKRFS